MTEQLLCTGDRTASPPVTPLSFPFVAFPSCSLGDGFSWREQHWEKMASSYHSKSYKHSLRSQLALSVVMEVKRAAIVTTSWALANVQIPLLYPSCLGPGRRKILLFSIYTKIFHLPGAFSSLPWKADEYLSFTESRGGPGSPQHATFPPSVSRLLRSTQIHQVLDTSEGWFIYYWVSLIYTELKSEVISCIYFKPFQAYSSILRSTPFRFKLMRGVGTSWSKIKKHRKSFDAAK